jgi:hypothetical protein
MGLTLRAGGPADDARGAAFRVNLGLPELRRGTVRFIETGGFRVAVVSSGAVALAGALARTARRQGAAFVVALLDDSFAAARTQLPQARDVDLLVAARPSDPLSAENDKVLAGEQTRLLQVASKGRSLARVDLVLRGEGRPTWLLGSAEHRLELDLLGERIELLRAQVDEPGATEALRSLKQAKLEELLARRDAQARAPVPEPAVGNLASLRFVPIEGTLSEDPPVAEVQRAADRDVDVLNLAWAQEHGQDCEAPTPANPGFEGTLSCGVCHPEALAVWKATKHPHAYEGLEKVGKEHHLDCIGCHVAGWQRPGGVCRVDRTLGRREVSCESCHGAGTRHLKEPVNGTIARGDTKETCVGCHDHENSPHFSYESYLQQIRGPGHGLPKAR